MTSITSKIHVIGITDETVTFNKADFDQALKELWNLMEKEKNNSNVGERVKLRWEGMYNILYEICSKWGKISY